MAEYKAISANLRVTNGDKARVCSVLNVAHDAAAQTVANFVDAIETIYNNGPCAARLSLALDLVR
ncbi:MAG: hypothetical protein FWE90_03865 [Defluviitaleaceae bacterium]|nr:hypothetical protein [Defluviitaleaceae bacterium]